MAEEHQIQKVKEKLFDSKKIVVLTGAGISAESGVPTFRGKDGLWRNFRAEELASPQAFQKNPHIVWEWYDWRRQILSKIKPNPAHLAIVELEKRFKDFTLITQNVDGLHTLAGGKNCLEIHGNIWRVRCTVCGKIEENKDVPIKILPMCECGGLLRPDIVWFGEMLPEDILNKAFNAAENCDFMLIAGTSGIVQPAASLAMIAKRNGAFVVEINLEETLLSPDADVTLFGKAGEILPEVVTKMSGCPPNPKSDFGCPAPLLKPIQV